MRISLLTKRVLFAVFLGGIIAAGCALPGYETDAGLSASSSSSSGTAQGGAGGTNATGGAGGAGGGGEALPLPLNCPPFYEEKHQEGSSCANFVNLSPAADTPKECRFANTQKPELCCVNVMVCVESNGDKLWKKAAAQPPCETRDPACPVGCALDNAGLACPGSPPPLTPNSICPCYAVNPNGASGGAPPPVCLFGQEICNTAPKEKFSMLACAPNPNQPMYGMWHLRTDAGCCVPNGQNVSVCKVDGITECKPVALVGAPGENQFVCLMP